MSIYPGGLDDLRVDHVPNEPIASADINGIADAVNKIERELGVNPSDPDATVAARLASLLAAVNLRQLVSQKDQANGYAGLDGTGKIASIQLPSIAVSDVFVVGSQAAQLALPADRGDVATRTDETKSYIHNGGTSGTMADWTLLLTPTDAVLSVAGKTGVVALVKADVGLANVDNTADTAKPVSTVQQTALNLKQDTSAKNAVNGYAGLDSAGKVSPAQLPALAITSVSVVGSQAEQLALVAQEGDVAVRTDQTKSYIHNAGTSGSMSDWTELAGAAGAVLSVAGKTGNVILAKADVGLGNADNTSDLAKPISTATQTALDNKQALSTILNTLASMSSAHAAALVAMTAFVRDNVLPATSAAALRTVLGLDPTIMPESRAPVASFTLASTDAGAIIRPTNGSGVDITATFPQLTDTTPQIPINSWGRIGRAGLGRLTLVAGTGATIRTPLSLDEIAQQYGQIEWWKQGTNTFWVQGVLA